MKNPDKFGASTFESLWSFIPDQCTRHSIIHTDRQAIAQVGENFSIHLNLYPPFVWRARPLEFYPRFPWRALNPQDITIQAG
jgi:hypothetical protein